MCCGTVASSPRIQREKETDAHKLAQRQKQIDYGKNTLGYQNYVQVWPRCASVICELVNEVDDKCSGTWRRLQSGDSSGGFNVNMRIFKVCSAVAHQQGVDADNERSGEVSQLPAGCFRLMPVQDLTCSGSL